MQLTFDWIPIDGQIYVINIWLDSKLWPNSSDPYLVGFQLNLCD
jgi:hypothetical protein